MYKWSSVSIVGDTTTAANVHSFSHHCTMPEGKGYTAGQRDRGRLIVLHLEVLGYLRGSEVTLQEAGHKHDDLVAQSLRTIPRFDLQDTPACGVHRVIIKAIGIPTLVQHIFDMHCLFSRYPVHSCIGDFWKKRQGNNARMPFN